MLLKSDDESLVFRDRWCQWKWVWGGLTILFALAGFIFLIWDHVKYQDESPPKVVAVFRDLFAIPLVCLVIVLCVQIAKYLSGKDEVWTLWIFCLVLYVACGFFWAVTQFYYDSGDHRHDMPKVVFVLKWIAMVYSCTMTVNLILIVMSS